MDAKTAGVLFTNTLSPASQMRNHNLLNGSGLALGDYDGDGQVDIFFCNLDGPCALYRNLGNWKFQDATAAAGLSIVNQLARGAAFADVNGDGHLDLIVTFSGKGARLFLNDGRGHFQDAKEASLVANTGSTSIALADVDGDGDLDLYVTNYGENTIRSGSSISVRVVNGKEQIVGRYRNRLKIINGRLVEFGEPDIMYLNDGRGHFTPVSWTGGAFLDENGAPLKAELWDLGLSAMFRDINQDGFPDLYVCNDFQNPDRVWLNNGRGQFRLIPRDAIRTSSHFAMGVDFADINRDGHDDFIVVDMLSRFHPLRITQISPDNPTLAESGEALPDRPQVRRNTLFLNRGDGTYAEIAQYSGVAASDWSWCPVFLDVDLDGYEDLLVVNGHLYDTQDLDIIEKTKQMRGVGTGSPEVLMQFPPLRTPNAAFRNRHDLTFEEIGQRWGFDSVQVSHGIALADLDNDGDLDVIVNCLNGPPLIYRNRATAPRVAVRLRGKAPNSRGIGARISLRGGAAPVQSQEIISGGRYLSSDDAMRVFAAGTLTNVMQIEIQWRSGSRTRIEGIRANQIYEIEEPETPAPERKPVTAASAESSIDRGQPSPSPQSAVAAVFPSQISGPCFEDVSSLLGHVHQQEPFDDFERQPLLPRKLSDLGPGVCFYDLDGDGWEDIVIGASRGGAPGAFHNNNGRAFSRWAGAPWNAAVTRDQSGLVVTAAQREIQVLIGSSNYQDGIETGPSVQIVQPRSAQIIGDFPGSSSSVGPLALGDLDGDGSLELFVGGRVQPGKYPEPAISRLFRTNSRGGWKLDETLTSKLANAGMVSGAVFSDLDGDGRAELVLACDWGPVRIYKMVEGNLQDETEKLGLTNFKGWWNGITTGDFDGDGQLDIVASNWGSNSKYQAHRNKPLRIYYGDLDGGGATRTLESYYDEQLKKWAPWPQLEKLVKAMPLLTGRFPSHHAYSTASIEEVLGDRFNAAKILEANWLETTVFLNRHGRFEAHALPAEAQFAPAFGVNVGDFNGDSFEDIFLSQNFFGTDPDTSRYDAGRGLWLEGDGRGNFKALSGQESGIKMRGEQRGSALADYDHDGRIDLLVAQNGGPSQLFHNIGAQPGLRVKIDGPPANPLGFGTCLRVLYGAVAGPVREVHGGDGYWSQSAATQLLGLSGQPSAIWVRGPGGKTNVVELRPGQTEIVLKTE